MFLFFVWDAPGAVRNFSTDSSSCAIWPAVWAGESFESKLEILNENSALYSALYSVLARVLYSVSSSKWDRQFEV